MPRKDNAVTDALANLAPWPLVEAKHKVEEKSIMPGILTEPHDYSEATQSNLISATIGPFMDAF